MQTWSTKDKSKWGDGPWQSEPDKAQWVDKKTGLDCLIVRGPQGALCGYVGVPTSHPFYGKSHNDIDARCHGGLTFAEKCMETLDPSQGICHTGELIANHDVWWFGFDCAHGMDISPGLVEMLGGYVFQMPGAAYRSFEYVQKEVERLANQLGGCK